MLVDKQQWDNYKNKLEKLFLATFGKEIEKDYMDWRYNSDDRVPLYFNIELDNDVPVASYSVFPVTLVKDGISISSTMSMTTMTHPNSQGKGYFNKLASGLYSHIKEEGVQFVWGFPNANSHPIFNAKLEWNDIYEIPTMSLDLSQVEKDWYKLSDSVINDDRFEDLEYSEVTDKKYLQVCKDKAYLQWRYANNPQNWYQNYVIADGGAARSFVVVKRFGSELDLVDIQLSDKQDGLELLSHIVRHAFDSGVTKLNCWAPSHHFLHPVAERIGFRNVAPITYMGGRVLGDEKLLPDLLNFRNWYIQMGDSDVY